MKKVLCIIMLGFAFTLTSNVELSAKTKTEHTTVEYYEEFEFNGKTSVNKISKEEFDVKQKIRKKFKEIKENKKNNDETDILIDDELALDIMSFGIIIDDGGGGGGGTEDPVVKIATPNGQHDEEKNYSEITTIECFESTIYYCEGNAKYYIIGNMTKLELKSSLDPDDEEVDVVAKLTWFSPPSQHHEDYFAIFYDLDLIPIEETIYRKTYFQYDYEETWYDWDLEETISHSGSATFDETVYYVANNMEFNVPNSGGNGGILWTFEPYTDFESSTMEGRKVYHDHPNCGGDGSLLHSADLTSIVYTLGLTLRTEDSLSFNDIYGGNALLTIESTYQHKIRDFDLYRVNVFTAYKAIFSPVQRINVIEETIYYTVDSNRKTKITLDLID